LLPISAVVSEFFICREHFGAGKESIRRQNHCQNNSKGGLSEIPWENNSKGRISEMPWENNSKGGFSETPWNMEETKKYISGGKEICQEQARTSTNERTGVGKGATSGNG